MVEEVVWPSTEDLVSTERLAKGDLHYAINGRGKIARAWPIDKSIIRALVRLEWLEAHHETYGLGFLELRTAFRARSLVRSGAVMLAMWGRGVSVSVAGDIYQNVVCGMRGNGVRVVEHACEAMVAQLADYDRGVYQEHFDRLVVLMDEDRERVKDAGLST